MFGETADDYVAWHDVPSLPKLDHRSRELATRLYDGPDSTIARFLEAPFDLDGWRVDCANTTARYADIDRNHDVAAATRRTIEPGATSTDANVGSSQNTATTPATTSRRHLARLDGVPVVHPPALVLAARRRPFALMSEIELPSLGGAERGRIDARTRRQRHVDGTPGLDDDARLPRHRPIQNRRRRRPHAAPRRVDGAHDDAGRPHPVRRLRGRRRRRHDGHVPGAISVGRDPLGPRDVPGRALARRASPHRAGPADGRAAMDRRNGRHHHLRPRTPRPGGRRRPPPSGGRARADSTRHRSPTAGSSNGTFATSTDLHDSAGADGDGLIRLPETAGASIIALHTT